MNRRNVPDQFRPHIIPVYPPNNEIIFEEWFSLVYQGCQTDRIFLDINFTSYWVNNDYGNNQQKRKEMQDYVDYLDNGKKYFCIIQYDDGCMVDWKGKDVLEFNMSKTNGVMMPLLCQPHPYKFQSEKKWLASFVGSRTHPVRNELDQFKGMEDYYISFDQHSPEQYCRILHESVYALCPRGYGLNSFRASEAMQYGALPVTISDNFIHPFDLRLYDYGVTLHSKHIQFLHETLMAIVDIEVIKKQEAAKKIYEEYYTYEGCFKKIITCLETEYNKRKV